MISSFLGAFTSGIDEVEEFFRVALWRVEAEWNPAYREFTGTAVRRSRHERIADPGEG
jgi:hypothetical protein